MKENEKKTHSNNNKIIETTKTYANILDGTQFLGKMTMAHER